MPTTGEKERDRGGERWDENAERHVPVRVAEADGNRMAAEARLGSVEVQMRQDTGKEEAREDEESSDGTQ